MFARAWTGDPMEALNHRPALSRSAKVWVFIREARA